MQLAFSADNRQKNYEAARQHASEIADNFSAGSFQVRSTFQIHVLGGQLNGTYQYSQLSREEYREEIETTDFSESVVSRGGELYFSRTKELEPLPILYLRELIYFARIMPVFAPISATTTSVLDGQNVKCYALERGLLVSEFSSYKACFNMDTGVLAAWEWSFNTELHSFEYSRFLHNGNKLYPGTMRRFHNGDLLAEVHVDSISNATMDAKLFDPPSNALKQAACKRFEPAHANYTDEYFQIRSDYKSGSVIIAGSVNDRGKTLDTEIQQSAGSKMDEAAIKALKEVHIHPAKCDGHAMPSLFRLQIWFSPALHPDSFESFR